MFYFVFYVCFISFCFLVCIILGLCRFTVLVRLYFIVCDFFFICGVLFSELYFVVFVVGLCFVFCL